MLDRADPEVSARMRVLKARLRHDVVRRLIREMMRPGEVGLDVGANRGVYTCLMSAGVGSRGRVHAVEPVPESSERLKIIARRRGNIAVHALAASDRSGAGVLRIPVHAGHRIDALASLGGKRAENGDDCEVVVCVRTLDELLEGERRVSFFKCDVEGHEQRVFQGAARILHQDRPIVFAEVEQRHREDLVESTFAFFADAGYSGWFAAEDGLRPLREFDVTRDQLDFVDGKFIPYAMPRGYVHDFLFCPPEIIPPAWGLGRRRTAGRRRA